MKTGRNDPCHCGSGKKYKYCCLPKDDEAAPSRAEESNYRTPGDGDMARMILSQTGFGSMSEMDAAMKRYGMYCENLPDNAPIPTFMEFLGRANPATEVSRKLGDELRGRDFSDMDELNRFTEGQMNAMSAAPQEDFEGISSALMHRLLYENARQNSDFVEISDELPDELALSGELVETSAWLLGYIAENGGEVRLTTRGNYPRFLCRSYLEYFDTSWTGKKTVPSESDLPVLFTAHDAVLAAGYTAESSTKATITTEGAAAVTRGSWATMFADLLHVSLDELDWLDWLEDLLRHSHFAIIQNSALFSLYLLHRHPSGTTGDFLKRFVQAFPAYLQPAEGKPELENLFRMEFERLFFDYFCSLYGLVRIEIADPDEWFEYGDEYEITELFRTAFNWKM